VGYSPLAMKFSTTSLISAALFVAGVSAQLTVNTPTNVVQCAPLTITWTGGTPPYLLSVHSGNDVNGSPLISFPAATTTSVTWSAVNFSAGTQLDLSLRDSSGLNSQSAIFTIQSGGDSSCLNGATNVTTPTGSAASAASPASATTPASSGASAATKPTSAASVSSASAASKSSSTGTSNAAMPTGVQYGVAGLLGAAVAAVFV